MFNLKPKPEGNILEREGRTVITTTATYPALLHKDVMIIYKNKEGNPAMTMLFVLNGQFQIGKNRI